jgi:hypothetical protein
LNDDDLDARSVFDLIIFVFLDSHIEGQLFLQKLLFDEEPSGWQRLGEISVLFEPSNHIWLEELVSIEDEQLSFLFIQVTVVVALSTQSGCAGRTCHIQQASLRNGKEVVATFTNDRPIECMEVLVTTLMLLMRPFTEFKLGLVLHELLEMRKSLFESRPDGHVFCDWSEFRTLEFIQEVVVLIEQLLLLISVAGDR